MLARIAPDPAVIDDNPDGDALARELCSPGGRREDCAAMLGAFLAGRRSAGDAGTALLFEDYMRRTLAGLR